MCWNVFTDGGCQPNPGGPGGWAWILEIDGLEIDRGSGRVESTTNNRMELTAAIHGLSRTPEDADVVLTSDSQYVVKGLTDWRTTWRRYGYAGVKNIDLWNILHDLADLRAVTAHWVRGHKGHPQNEECDRMATAAYRGKT